MNREQNEFLADAFNAQHAADANPLPGGKRTEQLPTVATYWMQVFLRVSSCERVQNQQFANAARPRGLTSAEFSILYVCATYHDDTIPQNEITRQIGISAAQTSGLLEKLRGRDLIQSQRLSNDRRKKIWLLTDRGKSLLSQILLNLKPLFDELKEKFGWTNGSSLLQLLDQLDGITRSASEFPSQRDAESSIENQTMRRVA